MDRKNKNHVWVVVIKAPMEHVVYLLLNEKQNVWHRITVLQLVIILIYLLAVLGTVLCTHNVVIQQQIQVHFGIIIRGW